MPYGITDHPDGVLVRRRGHPDVVVGRDTAGNPVLIDLSHPRPAPRRVGCAGDPRFAGLADYRWAAVMAAVESTDEVPGEVTLKPRKDFVAAGVEVWLRGELRRGCFELTWREPTETLVYRGDVMVVATLMLEWPITVAPVTGADGPGSYSWILVERETTAAAARGELGALTRIVRAAPRRSWPHEVERDQE